MDLKDQLALALDPSEVMRAQGLAPDPWQRALLLSCHRQVLLCCSRQSGKSRSVAALAVHTAVFQPHSLVLLLSPSLRQSLELFRKVAEGYAAVGRPHQVVKDSETQLELANGSRVVCLPGKEETVRSYSGVTLLVIDEAARVPDDLYRSVRPMLAVSQGRLVLLSTPFGKRGFFYEEWEHGGDAWHRVRIPWRQCPRITEEFIAGERRSMGDSWVAQEYETSFESLEGLVYPDFAEKCAVDMEGPTEGKEWGGIDFGFRNPFAAVWGYVTARDQLWVTHEVYLRQTPLHVLLPLLPRRVTWYADPSGAEWIEQLRLAGYAVRRGNNDIRAGIAAVTARVETGRLKVVRHKCPMLLAEAQLYRYPTHLDGRAASENPVDDHNHALGALRYLVSRLDARFLAKYRRRSARPPLEGPPADAGEAAESLFGARRPGRPLDRRRWDDEDLWTPLND